MLEYLPVKEFRYFAPAFLFLSLICSLGRSQINSEYKNHQFVLKGKIIGQDTGIIWIRYTDISGKDVRDTVQITSGRFVFSGKIIEPLVAFLKLSTSSSSVDIFIEPTIQNIILDTKNFNYLNMNGSKSQTLYNEVRLKQKTHEQVLTLIQKSYSQVLSDIKNDTNNPILIRVRDSFITKIKQERGKLLEIDTSFIRKHPASYVSPYILLFQLSSLDEMSLQSLYYSFMPKIKASFYGKLIKERLNGAVGNLAKNFQAVSLNNDSLSLNKYLKNKVLLLDFWATWCKPCRATHPDLIEIYNRYHKYGLEIISVANDDNRIDIWKKAIVDDNISKWIHILQGTNSKNDIGKLYGVSAIPVKILIDKTGMIVSRIEDNNTMKLKEQIEKIIY